MRGPSELYETLCRRRRAYGTHGMLTSDLEPPLQREESDALQEWLLCGAGPRGDLGMVAVLQFHWMDIFRGQREAASVKWRYVTGGRVSHAFVGDAAVPLCGVVAVRENGLPPHWRDDHGRYGHRPGGWHADCMRAAREGGLPAVNSMITICLVVAALVLVVLAVDAGFRGERIQAVFMIFFALLLFAAFSVTLSDASRGGLPEYDPETCVDLAHLDGRWTCIPREEAG